ncbi:MAG: hypothetical protein RR425_00555 [Erysipelotrichales bacterium]
MGSKFFKRSSIGAIEVLNDTKDMNMENYRQLHNIVLVISEQCFNIKKVLITAISALISGCFLITKDSGINKLDRFLLPLLFISLFIVILFWLYDSYLYYYQKKLRHDMKVKELIYTSANDCDIEIEKKCGQCKHTNINKALFNFSHLFYFLVAISLFIFYLVMKYQII